MTSLKFLGNGSAFNYDLDNTAAYFKYDNTFYIFDCGEKIASKIVKYINFSKENDVVICITHMHGDHIGSLEALLVYLTIINPVNSVTILCSNKSKMISFLKLTDYNYGLVKIIEDKIYKDKNVTIESVEAKHISDSRSYFVYSPLEKFFYSGDTCLLNKKAKQMLFAGELDTLYHEVSDKDSNFHIGLDTMCKEIPLEYRNRVFLMHFDSDLLIKKCIDEGFNIARAI